MQHDTIYELVEVLLFIRAYYMCTLMTLYHGTQVFK